MTALSTSRTVFIVAGDVSGDRSAAQLAAAIQQLAPDVRLIGVGGAAMRDAGVDVQVETTDFSAIGVFDAVHMLRPLVRAYRRAQRAILDTQPDLVVLVDSELVNLPAAVWLRRKGIPAVFFFPPQVWLWGRWRLPLIVPLVRRVLCAFRPEAEMFAAAGADTVWVGHPLCDALQTESPAAALAELGLDPARPLVALMPGSRSREVRVLAPAMLGAARLLQQRDPRLQFVLPVAAESLRGEIERQVAASGLHGLVLYEPRSYAVLSQARAVIQCSGTATLEVALLGIPAVIAYRLHPIEYFVGRRLVLNVECIGMPNILLGEMVQPEFFNRHVDAEHLAAETWSLLTDERRRRFVQSRLADVRSMLGTPGALSRAAQAVVDLLPRQLERTDDARLERPVRAPALAELKESDIATDGLQAAFVARHSGSAAGA